MSTARRICVGARWIGDGEPALILAEMASAHEGSSDLAHRLVEVAAEAGADAVQVQMYVAEQLVAPTRWDFSMTKAYELPGPAWRGIIASAREAGLLVWANVFDRPSLETALEAGVDAIKLHSSDTSNPVMLDAAARAGRPVSLSLGGSTADEAAQAVFRLRDGGAQGIVLMHGFQAFPTAPADSRLGYLPTLRRMFDCVVGYQDHTDGGNPLAFALPLVALGLGAAVIEKHYTFDRSQQGPDHESALDPIPLGHFVVQLRETERALRGGALAPFSEAEQSYRRRMKKHLVAARPLRAGDVLDSSAVALMRSDGGLLASAYEEALGHRVRRDFDAFEPIEAADLE